MLLVFFSSIIEFSIIESSVFLMFVRLSLGNSFKSFELTLFKLRLVSKFLLKLLFLTIEFEMSKENKLPSKLLFILSLRKMFKLSFRLMKLRFSLRLISLLILMFSFSISFSLFSLFSLFSFSLFSFSSNSKILLYFLQNSFKYAK